MFKNSGSVFSVQCTTVQEGGRGCMSNTGTLASNRQNTVSPKYNEDIPLLILQYLISATDTSDVCKAAAADIQKANNSTWDN